MRKTVWYVLTPAGEAGPYFSAQAARDEAKRFGWTVVSRQVEVEVERRPDWTGIRIKEVEAP
jgi:hypothetical protein